MYALEHDLRSRSWFPLARDEPISAVEVAVLTLCGLAAAYGVLAIDFSLRLPGHAILRAILPMSIGLALVPRRMAGTSMAIVAAGAACVVGIGGWYGIGAGAMTSLVLTGPLLDLAARWARRRGRLVAAFAVAGLVANLAALVARGASKLVLGDGRPFGNWIVRAAWSYPVCGLVAGAVAVLICFRMTGDDGASDAEENHP